MNPPLLPRRLPQGPVLGAKASFTRTLTEADVLPPVCSPRAC